MGDLISFVAGSALFIVAALVMIAYRPRRGEMKSAAGLLGLAIFLSFFADAANALYWQMFAKAGGNFGLDRTDIRGLGNYLDALFKGGAAIAGYLHLKALWMRVDEKEQPNWHWFEMPWYPERRQCLKIMSDYLRRK